MSKYESIFASVIGRSHLLRGEEKQDSVAILTDENGNTTFCLSDGAGSSKHSQISSKISADFISNCLLELPKEIEKRGVGAWINDYIVQCVLDLRKCLFDEFNTYDLRDYHCTLVAGILFQGNCLVAHIGDGAIIAGTADIKRNTICLNEKLVVSEAENGEYKNETFFLTEPHWLSHLRIKFIPSVDWLIAGTDGGIDLVSEGDKLNDNYVFELLSTLASLSRKRKQQTLQSHLGSAEADEITNDDKSLVIITSRKLTRNKSVNWDIHGPSFKDLYPDIKEHITSDDIKTPSLENSVTVHSGNISNTLVFKHTLFQLAEFVKRRPVLTSLSSVSVFLITYGLLMWPMLPPNSEITQPEIITSEIDRGSIQLDETNISDEVDVPISEPFTVIEQSNDTDTVSDEAELELIKIEVQTKSEEGVVTEPFANVDNNPLLQAEKTEINEAYTGSHHANPSKDASNFGELAEHGSSDDNMEPTLEDELRSEAPRKDNIKIENLRTSHPVAPTDDPKDEVFSNLD